MNNPLRVGIALATQLISDRPANWAECVWLVNSWVDRHAGPHTVQSVHILLGENRSGADRTCLQLRQGKEGRGRQILFSSTCEVTGTHPLVKNRRGPVNLVWRQSVVSWANFSAGVIPRRLNILSLNLCELAIYYTINTHKQTNKHI